MGKKSKKSNSTQPVLNKAQRASLLQAIRKIMSDGRPRNGVQVAAIMSNLGLSVDASHVYSVFDKEGRTEFAFDKVRQTYAIIRKPTLPATTDQKKQLHTGNQKLIGKPRKSFVSPGNSDAQAKTFKPVDGGKTPIPLRSAPVIGQSKASIVPNHGADRAVGGRTTRVQQPSVPTLPSPIARPVTPPRFEVLARVRPRAMPDLRGRIVSEPREYADKWEYLVQFGNDEGWYAEADLEPVSLDGLPRWERHDEFQRDLLLTKLRTRLTDNLYAYGGSRTEFVPYQFRPALKFLRNPDQRLLIADEVGLGKTIEAAIIYLELKARLNISRVLILCPSRLKSKWRDEMRHRFDEEFEELDTTRVRRFIDDHRRTGGRMPLRAIASFEMLRNTAFAEAWQEHQINLDLLIVDEAHYMRNEETATFRLGTALTDHADAVVFLSATPLHLHHRDLYNLLNLLAPGEFDDPNLFEQLVRPNAFINRANSLLGAGDAHQAEQALRQVEHTTLRDRFLKNPYYHDVLDRLRLGVSGVNERIALQQDLLELNTLSRVFTRTRKREVQGAAVRAAYSVHVELTPAERRFYDGILEEVRHDLRRGKRGAPSFAVIMKERQAASSLAAMREAYAEAGRKHRVVDIGMDRAVFDLVDDDPQLESSQHLQKLGEQTRTVDSKFRIFEETLRQSLAEDSTSKALVFSFFRRTLDYLQRQLRAQGYTVDVISGGVPMMERQQIIERFRNDPRRRVLLSSEVGAEGLDFQFCDILVNYDLPWNPMQVEQRIGRLDRFGQSHARIRIYNFYIAETIETRIFQRLYERIGIFKQSIGDLEAILGEVIRELSEAALQASLTPQEQERLAELAAERIARVQWEEQQFEQAKYELVGQERILGDRVNDAVSSGRVVSSAEVCALVQSFLEAEFPRNQFIQDDEDECWTLAITPPLVAHLEQYIVRHPGDTGGSARFQEMLHGSRLLPLTFDSELARRRPLLEFITIRHPLAGAAVEYWRRRALEGVPSTCVEVVGPEEETGEGYFFIYLLSVTGAQQQIQLQPVIVLDDDWIATETAETLLSQLQTSRNVPVLLAGYEDDFVDAQEVAAEQIALLRDRVRVDMDRRNTALIAARRASLETSYAAKIRRTQDLSAKATDANIRRMRDAQVRNLEAALRLKLAQVDKVVGVSVFHKLVAGGRIRIVAPE